MRYLIFLCLFCKQYNSLHIKRIIFITFLVCHHFLVFAQTRDSVLSETPIRKGRWIAILSGVINSGTVIRPDSALSNERFSNNYAFSIIGLKVIKDRTALGLIFTINRLARRNFSLENRNRLMLDQVFAITWLPKGKEDPMRKHPSSIQGFMIESIYLIFKVQ